MEEENINLETAEPEQGNQSNRVTTLSKYLAMTLFILMPFIGGWIGYVYAPEKVVEIEKVREDAVNNTTKSNSEYSTDVMLDSISDGYIYFRNSDEVTYDENDVPHSFGEMFFRVSDTGELGLLKEFPSKGYSTIGRLAVYKHQLYGMFGRTLASYDIFSDSLVEITRLEVGTISSIYFKNGTMYYLQRHTSNCSPISAIKCGWDIYQYNIQLRENMLLASNADLPYAKDSAITIAGMDEYEQKLYLYNSWGDVGCYTTNTGWFDFEKNEFVAGDTYSGCLPTIEFDADPPDSFHKAQEYIGKFNDESVYTNFIEIQKGEIVMSDQESYHGDKYYFSNVRYYLE